MKYTGVVIQLARAPRCKKNTDTTLNHRTLFHDFRDHFVPFYFIVPLTRSRSFFFRSDLKLSILKSSFTRVVIKRIPIRLSIIEHSSTSFATIPYHFIPPSLAHVQEVSLSVTRSTLDSVFARNHVVSCWAFRSDLKLTIEKSSFARLVIQHAVVKRTPLRHSTVEHRFDVLRDHRFLPFFMYIFYSSSSLSPLRKVPFFPGRALLVYSGPRTTLFLVAHFVQT